MRHGVSGALLAALVLGTGCSATVPEVATQVLAPRPPAPAYDGHAQPARAVLSLVPARAATVTVTDFDQVRAELGMEEVGRDSTAQDVTSFWSTADSETALLAVGMLRGDDVALRATYDFGQIDVAWEVHFFDADGASLGWVLRMRNGTDMARVAAAARDAGNPLSAAEVDPGDHLVARGTAGDPEDSWAADSQLEALAGRPSSSTYLSRDCLGATDEHGVDELGPFSVQFQGSLVTAWLGTQRPDLFTRMRLGAADPAFAAACANGAADPRSGRIGYLMRDPVAASRLALSGDLPFAACAEV